MSEYLLAEMVEHHGTSIVISCPGMHVPGIPALDGAKSRFVLQLHGTHRAQAMYASIIGYLEMTDVYLHGKALHAMVHLLLGPEYLDESHMCTDSYGEPEDGEEDVEPDDDMASFN